MSNKMLNKLKQTYEENEEQVSFDLWDKLESRLDENVSEEASKTETPKPSFGWFKYAAIFLIFATLGGVLFLNSNNEAEQNQIVKAEENQVEKNENSNEQIIETQPTESVEIISNKTQIANVEAESKTTIQTNSNSNSNQTQFKPKNASIKKEVETIEKPQNILAQNPEVKEEIQQNVPKIMEQKNIVEIQPEQKVIAKNRKSYIKASDLLFGRELQKTAVEKGENHQENFGRIDFSRLRPKEPSEVKVLGTIIFSDEIQP